jgi:hypothetical protein
MEQSWVVPQQVPWVLAERSVKYIVALDAPTEVRGNIRQRNDGMTPVLIGKVIDQVDDPVLETTYPEAVYYVRNQRGFRVHASYQGRREQSPNSDPPSGTD